MTVRATTTRIRHDSDATFREWIQEWETSLSTIGLVQTADTGQINTATATRPAVSTSAGYQIWRFNDPLQATAPIFLRFEYRTGTGATNPLIRMGIGTATDGAGTLTGTNYAPTDIQPSSAQATDTTRNSFWCHKPGFVAWDYKSGATSQGCCGGVFRVCDNTGSPTGDGLIVVNSGTNFLVTRYMRFGAGAAVGAVHSSAQTANLCHWPFDLSTSVVGLDPQVATIWAPMPRFMPIVGMVGVLDGDAAVGTTFPFTAVGSTPRTYLACTNYPHLSPGSKLKPAIIYEA